MSFDVYILTVSDRLKTYLGIRKPVTIDQVISQLSYLQTNITHAISSYQLTKRICYDIYQFIQVGNEFY